MPSTSGSKVFASDGRVLTLGKLVKSGGAGAIHRIAEAGELVAKIYHPQVDHAVYERKVAAMLALAPDLPDSEEGGVREVQTAWPRLLLRDRQQRFLGFAMPLIDFAASVELECVMQERQARAQGLPTGLGAKVTLAANLAGIIAALHGQGHYVVDLKPVNLRFYRRSLHVTLLDCDGLSIKGVGERFRAPQYTPEYLAPELHARAIADDEEESQDRFALAVVVFQLLNFGIHPYSGRPRADDLPTDIPGRIARGLYAYGAQKHAQMAPSPASGHLAMPAELRAMFDRAFGSAVRGRPAARAWAELLRGYAQRSSGQLVACAQDGDHQHFAGMPCATCARNQLVHQAKAAAATRPRTTVRTARPPARVSVRLGVTWTRPRVATPPATPAPASQTPGAFIAILVTLVVVFLLLGRSGACERRASRYESQPGPSMASRRWRPPTRNLDEVLRAVKAADGPEAVLAELPRLPGHRSYEEEEQGCQAVMEAWQSKTRWLGDDPALSADPIGARPAPPGAAASTARRSSCDELIRSTARVVRIAELCKLRQHSPGFYPGIAETACQEHRILEAAVDTLRDSILRAPSSYDRTWRELAETYLLADDFENAQTCLIVAAVLHRESVLGMHIWPGLYEPWLREREEILLARAVSKVARWHGREPLPSVLEQAVAPWPEDPPPRVRESPPARQKPQRARAKR
jgi:eukaryotic-like serine/threonine-protein kinase